MYIIRYRYARERIRIADADDARSMSMFGTIFVQDERAIGTGEFPGVAFKVEAPEECAEPFSDGEEVTAVGNELDTVAKEADSPSR